METQPLYKTYLSEELAKRLERNPAYSLRAFAKACGLSAGTLSQVISGSRIPSYKMAEKILAALELSPAEQKNLLSELAKIHQSRGLKRLSPAFKKMTDSAPQAAELSLDLFRVIGDWCHYAVLMLTYVESFQSNAKWIASQLSITEMEAKLAVERLINVGLLEDVDGTYRGTNGHFTTADKHLTNAALKRHVKQSLEKAIDSVDNDPI